MKRVMDSEKFSFANAANATFVETLYERYTKDPESVDESWRGFFAGFEFACSTGADVPKASATGAASDLEAKVEAFINLYRRLGHLSAHLDPLSGKPDIGSFLSPKEHGLDGVKEDMSFTPANLPGHKTMSFGEIKKLLVDTYCGTVGADFRELNNIEAVTWLQDAMESSLNKPSLDTSRKLRILEKLMHAEGFERFLQDRYLGQKRFSIEGLESLIPLLDTVADEAKSSEVEEICMGMAHRGRLNVLSNFLGKPYEMMLREFEGSDVDSYGIDGDVKYHKGFASYIETASGQAMRVYLSPNPSHLEAVNPVVEGFTRARQQMLQDSDRKRVLPLLIHGDASFIGQGIVAETLNLSELMAYKTGGTIHIITNNQVGFTTDPEDSRSCHYSSDIAKMVRAPVLHVNADDPEAVVWAAQLATSYRQKFQKDVVIDLVGYRRHGHNETDEPSFTQPRMYRVIKSHPTAYQIYKDRLVKEGVISADVAETRMTEFRAQLQEHLNSVRSKGNVEVLPVVPREFEVSTKTVKASEKDLFKTVKTGVDTKTLQALVASAVKIPEGFHIHPKVKKLFDSRIKMMEGKGNVDWGLAEWLAYGSLALEKYPVRLSGQDCRRGTFSHRHAVIQDYENGETLAVLNQLSQDQASIDVINSPLSEQGVLGFEFGYSVACPDALVLWEAQFGDFSNGAQIIIDQFLAASEAKWKQTCGLVMLLPHGYEGMGPEHSSARPERFLQLCGDYNMQVANPTTPAQLFHLLRRQVLRGFRKPLVIMTPKSLLRHPMCVSELKEFSSGSFNEVLDDAHVGKKSDVERVVFCSGKIYYDLLAAREKKSTIKDKVAIVRIEQLYPFAEKKVSDILEGYKSSKSVVWAQEEPSNMGAWTFIRHRIKKLCTRQRKFRYIGRTSAGTTAEGTVKAHQKEQARIIDDVFDLKAEPTSKSAKKA